MLVIQIDVVHTEAAEASLDALPDVGRVALHHNLAQVWRHRKAKLACNLNSVTRQIFQSLADHDLVVALFAVDISSVKEGDASVECLF